MVLVRGRRLDALVMTTSSPADERALAGVLGAVACGRRAQPSLRAGDCTADELLRAAVLVMVEGTRSDLAGL